MAVASVTIWCMVSNSRILASVFLICSKATSEAVRDLLSARLLHRLSAAEERSRGLDPGEHHERLMVAPFDDLVAATVLLCQS